MRPKGAQGDDLFLAHFVRQHEDRAVSLQRGDHRQADAGIAGGRLHQRSARPQQAAPLGVLDQLQADAVLDGAARVQELAFDINLSGQAFHHPIEPHQGGSPDALQNAVAQFSHCTSPPARDDLARAYL